MPINKLGCLKTLRHVSLTVDTVKMMKCKFTLWLGKAGKLYRGFEELAMGAIVN